MAYKIKNQEEYNKKSKKNRHSGRDFELSVRKDLESKGWIVGKWPNTVEFEELPGEDGVPFNGEGKLIPAKHVFNPFGRCMVQGTGCPDFIAFKNNHFKTDMDSEPNWRLELEDFEGAGCFEKVNLSVIIGVEAKKDGYVKPSQKEICAWLIKNNIFSKILIASKCAEGIEYKEFK